MVVVFGNTANHTTSWRSEPNNRGSWSILSSCIITISLCAWTALHLNVPEHGTASRQWLRKTKWLGLGLAAPEMVVYVAWRQRQEAKRLLRDVKKQLGQTKQASYFRRVLDKCRVIGKIPTTCNKVNDMATSPTSVSLSEHLHRPEWSLVHGFYAVMGGFAFDSSEASEAILPDSRTRATLTTSGIRFLLEHEPDLLPDVTEDQIKDKSKADGLKKLLVCAQALWFCTSCMMRLASSLPISLLELNAMGHAACALLVYTMWWEKPLDIAEPTLIRGSQAQPLLAVMWMSSRISAKGLKSHDLHGQLRDEFDGFWMYQVPRPSDLVTFTDTHETDTSQNAAHVDGDGTSPLRTQPQICSSSSPPSCDGSLWPESYAMYYRHYNSGSTTLSFRYRIISWLHSKRCLAYLGFRFPAGLGVRKTAIEHVSPTDIARWKLSYNAIRKYNLEDDICARHRDRSYVYDEDSRVKAEVRNLLSLFGSRPLEVWLGFAVAGLLYGGLHLLAWNAPFTSSLEQILWRVAASSVTMTPILLAPVALMFGCDTLKQGSEDLIRMARGQDVERSGNSIRFWARVVPVVMFLPLFAVGPLLWFTYVLGRIYLVVECFKSIAYLPEGAFENASWPANLPHII